MHRKWAVCHKRSPLKSAHGPFQGTCPSPGSERQDTHLCSTLLSPKPTTCCLQPSGSPTALETCGAGSLQKDPDHCFHSAEVCSAPQHQVKGQTGLMADRGARIKGRAAAHNACSDMSHETGKTTLLELASNSLFFPQTAVTEEAKATGCHQKQHSSFCY